MLLLCYWLSLPLPANPQWWLGQVHVQCSQQQIDVMDPQIHTKRDYFETANTHLTKHNTTSNFRIFLSVCKRKRWIYKSDKFTVYLLRYVVVPCTALQISKFLPVAIAEWVAGKKGLQGSSRWYDMTLNGRQSKLSDTTLSDPHFLTLQLYCRFASVYKLAKFFKYRKFKEAVHHY